MASEHLHTQPVAGQVPQHPYYDGNRQPPPPEPSPQSPYGKPTYGTPSQASMPFSPTPEGTYGVPGSGSHAQHIPYQNFAPPRPQSQPSPVGQYQPNTRLTNGFHSQSLSPVTITTSAPYPTHQQSQPYSTSGQTLVPQSSGGVQYQQMPVQQAGGQGYPQHPVGGAPVTQQPGLYQPHSSGYTTGYYPSPNTSHPAPQVGVPAPPTHTPSHYQPSAGNPLQTMSLPTSYPPNTYQPAPPQGTPTSPGYSAGQYPSGNNGPVPNGQPYQQPQSYPTTYGGYTGRRTDPRIGSIDYILCQAEEIEPQIFSFIGRRGMLHNR